MSQRVTPQDDYLLRSEWLRFKSHLYDASTELPTLPAVLDEARRLLEERGTLGLLYLDLGCRRRALSTVRSHVESGKLFLNTSAAGLRDPALLGRRSWTRSRTRTCAPPSWFSR